MNQFLQWLKPGHDAARQAGTAERKSVAGPFFALHGLAEAGWSAADAGSLARAGFARNPVVYRCVRMISEAAAAMPWLLFDGADELDTHPLIDLLTRPNERQAGQAFLEALYGHLLIAGNAYAQVLALDGAPRELHLLRPDCVSPVPGADGWPEAYDYTAGSRRTRIEAGGTPARLIHLTLFNPVDEVCGLPPMAAARAALDIHNAASRWNKALLDNAARPSGALVYTALEQGNLTEEQFERLKSELEAGYAGAANAGRPMVLEGGLDWKAMGFSPKDMDFIQAKHGAARDIALAFGVPPMLLGIPGDNTYSNFQEANRAFWRQTVLPLANRIAGALGAWLGGWFGGEDLRLDFDRDRVEALSPDREALWRRLNEATFLTADEKREAAGYGPSPEMDTGSGLGPQATELKYDPSQPRVPVGNPDGGEWTNGGGGWGISHPDTGVGDGINIHDPPIETVYPEFALLPFIRSGQLARALLRFVASRRRDADWSYGKFKSARRWANQMERRKWTPQEITATIQTGKRYRAPNYVNPGNKAIRYENLETGKYIVRDEVTKEILQLGDKLFIRK